MAALQWEGFETCLTWRWPGHLQPRELCSAEKVIWTSGQDVPWKNPSISKLNYHALEYPVGHTEDYKVNRL